MRRFFLCLVCLLGVSMAGSVDAADAIRIGREVGLRLEARVQTLLDRMLGPGQAGVLVRVEIDASRVEEVRVVTTSGPPRSRWRAEAAGAGGRRMTEGARYAVSRSVFRRVKAHPRIGRISAVVFVDEAVRPRVDLPAIRAMIGITERRGDRFVVTAR